MTRYAWVAAALLLFVATWVGYTAGWPWLTAADQWALTRTFEISVAHPAWVTFWDVVCTVFGPALLRVVGVGVMVVALIRRNTRAALLVLLAVELSGVVTQVVKWVADRARPDAAMVQALGTSFPSGHALAVAAAAVTTLALTAGWSTRRRAVLLVALTTVVLAVGFGRVALNVHHPSDVVAGWALGYAYAALCVLLLRPSPLTRDVTPADERPAEPGTAR